MAIDNDITLTIHGLTVFNDEVDGEVFAEKFSAFMRGLAAADEAANGERRHKFIIADLRKNTATAQIVEKQTKGGPEITHSGTKFYGHAVEEIRLDSPAARLLPLDFVKSVVSLNRGVARQFEFGEIKLGDANVIRIDEFLAERAERVLADIKRQDAPNLSFEGVAYGSFDGILRAVDFQPAMKRGTLRLTAGNVPIVCNIGSLSVDEVSSALERRAVFYGLAHYDGKNGLPQLIDVRRIDPIQSGQGLARWRGAFTLPRDDSDDDWQSH